MMRRPHLVLLAVALGALTSACSALRGPSWPKVSPVELGGAPTSAADGYYGDARAAMTRGDYGRALDLLQLARGGGPPEARVLNALAVVYDKLGRFDLSARYYAEALQADPGSSIVATNLAYSQILQGRWAHRTGVTTVAVGSTSVEARIPQPVTTTATQAATTSPAPATQAKRSKWSPTVLLIDASGDAPTAELVRARLKRLGWSASPLIAGQSVQRTTVIRYPPAKARVARALAGTLPGPSELQTCDTPCALIVVTLSADVRRWPLARFASTTSKMGG